MRVTGKYLFIILTVSSMVVQLDAVTVNPSLCPTNKIAPHRRHASWDQGRPRTLGLFFDLLAPGRPSQIDPLNDLQEQPQEDDPDDCGEIEDYDETDLSSVTPGAQRRKSNREDRYLFGNNYIVPPPYYQANRPSSTANRPQRPARPQYNFHGMHGSNVYRPTSHPADYVKPVKEDVLDHPQASYRPGLVGGTLGHIVGFAPVRPTTELPPQRIPNSRFRFPESDYVNKRQKKSQQTNKSTSIIGSFVDLLFN